MASLHPKNFFLNTSCHIKVMSHDYDVTLRGGKGWDCFDSGRQIVVYYADIALGSRDVGVSEELLDGTEVVGLGVGGGGEPVPELVRGAARAEEAGYFFGDVIAAAVPGEAARKVVSGLFCFEVGEEFMVGWDDPGVAALAGNVKPSIGVVLGVESSDF